MDLSSLSVAVVDTVASHSIIIASSSIDASTSSSSQLLVDNHAIAHSESTASSSAPAATSAPVAASSIVEGEDKTAALTIADAKSAKCDDEEKTSAALPTTDEVLVAVAVVAKPAIIILSSLSNPSSLSSSSTLIAPVSITPVVAVDSASQSLNGGFKRGGAANDPITGVYDEIEIQDMEYDDETESFVYPCPCGDNFIISKSALLDGEDIARCQSCSLIIKVIYDPEDLEDEE